MALDRLDLADRRAGRFRAPLNRRRAISQRDAATHARGVVKDSSEISLFELRVIGQNLALALACGKPVQHIPNSDAQAADAGLSRALSGFDRDSVVDHDLPMIAPGEMGAGERMLDHTVRAVDGLLKPRNAKRLILELFLPEIALNPGLKAPKFSLDFRGINPPAPSGNNICDCSLTRQQAARRLAPRLRACCPFRPQPGRAGGGEW